MPDATDYWLRGMEVARADQKDYVDAQHNARDARTKNKLYYGEDWVGDEKGNTDFRASEAARKRRLDEDAKAAAEVYLGTTDQPIPSLASPKITEGTSENEGITDPTFGVPKSAAESLPNARAKVPVTSSLGAPSDVPVVRVVTPPKLDNTDSAEGDYGNWDSVMASLPKETVPQVQLDAPRYIPVEGNLGAPPVIPVSSVPVGPNAVPPVAHDFGLSAAPISPARPAAVVPNTSTFGAPEQLPTARQIFERTDPVIRDNPHFRTELANYEKNRMAMAAKYHEAEILANIRTLGALQQALTKGQINSGLETQKQTGREALKEKDIEGKSGLEEKKQEGREELLQLKLANQQLVASGKPPVLDKATEREVSELGSAVGKKSLIADSLVHQAEQIENPNLPPALRLFAAKESLKTLNSDQGRDAVGKEEAERIGGLLKANLNLSDFILGRPLLPDIKLFTEQVKNKSQSLQNDVVQARNRIRQIYAPYGYDPENPRTAAPQMRNSGFEPTGTPSLSPGSASPSAAIQSQAVGVVTNAPVRVNSEAEWKNLSKGTSYIDSSGVLKIKK